MPRIIAVANQKGGVGKTTTVANLGAALAALGKKTILVDLDPQGALTACFGLDPYTLTRTAYTLLVHPKASLAGALQPISEQLALVPASVDLAAVEYQILAESDRVERLRHVIGQSRIPADFVLLDTPPTLNLLTVNALVAATELLIPVQCSYLAMRGVRGLLESVWRIHERYNQQLGLLGVLPTMYNAQSEHAQEVLDELRAVFEHKVLRTVIAEDEVIAKAPAAQLPVAAYQPASPAAQVFHQLAQEIINGVPS